MSMHVFMESRSTRIRPKGHSNCSFLMLGAWWRKRVRRERRRGKKGQNRGEKKKNERKRICVDGPGLMGFVVVHVNACLCGVAINEAAPEKEDAVLLFPHQCNLT